MVEASKRRLALWDISENQIRELEEKGEAQRTLTLYAPQRRARKGAAKDYLERLKRFQRRPLGVSAAKALEEENRGSR